MCIYFQWILAKSYAKSMRIAARQVQVNEKSEDKWGYLSPKAETKLVVKEGNEPIGHDASFHLLTFYWPSELRLTLNFPIFCVDTYADYISWLINLMLV